MTGTDDQTRQEPAGTEHSSEAQAAEGKVNDPLTRSDAEAPQTEWKASPGSE